jgi:hypothetical protein
MGKLMERIVTNRLEAYLESNNILDKEQEGFRYFRSTTNALLTFVQSIFNGLNQKESTVIQIVPSSSNLILSDFVWENMSLMNTLNRIGEITHPCGCPIPVWNQFPVNLLTTQRRYFRSTTNALLTFVQSIFNGLNQKESTVAVFIDLEKAFDSVWREGLLVKLAHVGVKGKLWTWLQFFPLIFPLRWSI